MSFTLEPQEYLWLCMAYVGDVIQRVLAAGMRCVLTISTNVYTITISSSFANSITSHHSLGASLPTSLDLSILATYFNQHPSQSVGFICTEDILEFFCLIKRLFYFSFPSKSAGNRIEEKEFIISFTYLNPLENLPDGVFPATKIECIYLVSQRILKGQCYIFGVPVLRNQ